MKPLTPQFERVPSELRKLPRWVCWRMEQERKVPYDPKALNARASSTDPTTWATFEEAQTAYLEREGDADAFSGAGIVLNGDGLAGVDIDHCVKDGKPDPAALELLDSMGAAYVEISPSGTGLRAFGYAERLESGCKGTLNGLDVELYSTGRYLTLTGHTLKAGPIAPLHGFAQVAQRIRADRKTDPKSGETVKTASDEKHAELVRRILSGDVFHDSLRDLAASMVATGMQPGAVVNHLRGLMDASAANKDERWSARRAQIPDLVNSAAAKFEPLDFAALVEQASAANEPLLKPVSVFDVLTNPAPPPDFVWDDYLPRGVVALWGAHGGTGKSTCALMLAVAVATGRPLFGVNTTEAPAVFVSLEDGARIVRNRLAHICRAWGIDPLSLADRLHIVDGTENPELFSAEARGAGEVTAAYRELSRLVSDTRAGLVVVDNASDSFGGDEINRRQVRGFMRALVQVARLTECAVCLLAHVDKSTSRNKYADGGEGYSGSTAWHNSARSRLFMTRDASGLLTLEHQKSNLGKRRESVALEWPEGGLPVLASEAPNFDGLTARALGKADDESAAGLLRVLAEFESRKQYASPATTARNNVYSLLSSEPAFRRLKLKKTDTARIVNQCQRAGWIEVIEYRTKDRKDRERWAVTALGRDFAGLPSESAPTAPTAPTYDESANSQDGAGGAPAAPTCVGGTGESASANEGAFLTGQEKE